MFAPSITRASDCEALPSQGQASLEKAYMKIKAESEHADTDCEVRRVNNIAGYSLQLQCRIHFRPRNGGCYVDFSPYGEIKHLSNHPGCDPDKWAWAQDVAMNTGASAKTPTGQTVTGAVRFNMLKEEYELKYQVVVGAEKSSSAAYNYYSATLKEICIRKAG
jgi:hypothetical protein